MLTLWLSFFACAAIIIFIGVKLTRYGDIIAEKSGLGRVWIGAALIPLATALPEISSSASAAWINAPDLAIGNVFGSIMFNLLIISFIDIAHGPGPIFKEVDVGQILTAILGIFLFSIAIFSMIIRSSTMIFGVVGIGSLILFIIYFLGILIVFRYSKKNRPKNLTNKLEEQYSSHSLTQTNIKFVLAGTIIVLTSMEIAKIANQLAELTGWGTTFMGTILLAFITSLPELVTSIAAIRIKAYDLALGIILGANILNMTIPFFSDVFYSGAPILSVVSSQHLISALMCIILTSIAIGSAVYKPRKAIFHLDIAAWLIMLGYFLGIHILFNVAIKL